jgi:hypothetical protein
LSLDCRNSSSATNSAPSGYTSTGKPSWGLQISVRGGEADCLEEAFKWERKWVLEAELANYLATYSRSVRGVHDGSHHLSESSKTTRERTSASISCSPILATIVEISRRSWRSYWHGLRAGRMAQERWFVCSGSLTTRFFKHIGKACPSGVWGKQRAMINLTLIPYPLLSARHTIPGSPRLRGCSMSNSLAAQGLRTLVSSRL